MIHPSHRQTDGQTDGRAIAYTRNSIYTVTRKKHANSILESFEYFCQMSSKSIFIILSYRLKVGAFFETM